MAEQMEFTTEPKRRTPVYKRTSVLVCGSGSAGLAAAISAARNGTEVQLVERNSFLGGESAYAYQNWFGGPTDILAGFAKEWAERLDRRGAAKLLERYKTQTTATGIQPLTYHIAIEPEEWKNLAEEMIEEAGVKVLTNTWVADAIVEDRNVKGIIIENKSGRQAIMADVVIDATGDADVAARAGAPFDKLPKNGYLNPMVPGFRLGGINYPKIAEYARQHPEDFRPGAGVPPGDFDGENVASVEGLRGWFSLVEEGRKTGEFPDDMAGIGLQCNPNHICRGIGYFIGSHLSTSMSDGKRYPWNADDVRRSENDARKRAPKFVEFLRRRVPGFEGCFLLDISQSVAPWDSRRINWEYVFTRADLRNGCTFDDDICIGTVTWPDVHVSEDSGWMMHPLVEELDGAWRETLNSPRFQVIFGTPYRCLIPKGFDGILVAGPTISLTYMAHEPGPNRGMIPCMHWGQAAGTAAAIASSLRISPKQVEVANLREILKSQGAILDKNVIDLSEVTKRLEAGGGRLSHAGHLTTE